MAAAALAIGLGTDLDDIRVGLRRYGREYSMATVEDYPAAFWERSDTGKDEVSRAQA